MDQLVIEGGIPLKGSVTVSGSKNACLPMLCATLLTADSCHFTHVPDLEDMNTLMGLLTHLGAKAERSGHQLEIHTQSVHHFDANYELVRKMRASILVLGPLLARFGEALVSLPGGCAIGARPVDLHLKGLEAMGAHMTLEHGYIHAKAPKGGLTGAQIVLDSPSVGATEQLMMAACLAKGKTLIQNAALEPEIEELALLLKQMGAHIQGAGTSQILIEGVNQLKGASHRAWPDRIEAGTLMAAAAITKGQVQLFNFMSKGQESVLSHFQEAGCHIHIETDDQGCETLLINCEGPLKSVNMKTAPYPGFPTDMQAQWMACMSVAEGVSEIEETIFENRFMHVQELNRLGAHISLHGNVALIKGVKNLEGAPVMATDLRASASLVLAGLCALGKTQVLRIYHLDRGYERLEDKLARLGARIYRTKQT